MQNNLEKLQQARLRAREKGFTLVELAIVLVIIGLIVGGVLVGQDLIKAAEIRAQITQIEQFNAAVNTYRVRFNGLPGDIRNARNMFDNTLYPNIRDGNGNRQIEIAATAPLGLVATPGSTAVYSAVPGTASVVHSGEALQFWHQLSAAQLIPGQYTGAHTSAAIGAELGVAFPATKLDRNGIGVYTDGGRGYYQIGVISSPDFVVAPSLTPEEASNIDGKIDDGKPGTGVITVRSSQGASTAANAPLTINDGGGSETACISETFAATPPTAAELRDATYNISVSEVNIACSLRIRISG